MVTVSGPLPVKDVINLLANVEPTVTNDLPVVALVPR
jgi:hypothetical protein